MRFRGYILTALLGLSFLAGCSDTSKPEAHHGGKSAGSADSGAVNVAALEPLLLAQAPSGVVSVKEAKAKKQNEKVVVRGQVPPENVKPFNPGVAAFVMLSPEDLQRDEVKEELACDDAPTCPRCRKMLNELGVRVELVDPSGKVIPSSLEGFRSLRGGSFITIEGVIHRDGKDGKDVRIVAQRFYPG